MNILIVGGLGYIGGRFAAHLKKQYPNYSIHLTTRKKSRPPWASTFEFHHLDLMETASINQCLNTLYPEIVFHLGALQQVECDANPMLARKINVEGTRHLVEDCEKHNVKKYIYLSTFQVYGNYKGILTEETPPHPKSIYAQTKFEGEQIVRESSMQTFILRLSNAYGYPMDMGVPQSVWTLAFNAFILSAFKDQRITVASNQFRDFITLNDVCRALEHLAFKAPNLPKHGVTMNIGGKECLTIQQAAQRVVDVYEAMYPGQKVSVSVEPEDQTYESFRYQIERLEETGFQLYGFRKEEIIKTFELLRRNIDE